MKEKSGIEVAVEKVSGGGGVVMLRCVGYLDTYNTGEFSREVNSVIAAGARNLVFDLSKVTYMSSTPVGSFTTFLKRVKRVGGDMVLLKPTARVLEVLKLLGFASFFNVEDTLQEALEHFPPGAVREVPFEKMQGITAAFARLERYVPRDQQPEFYADVLAVLRQLRGLQAALPVSA
jgi:anti-anti-sigma factor